MRAGGYGILKECGAGTIDLKELEQFLKLGWLVTTRIQNFSGCTASECNEGSALVKLIDGAATGENLAVPHLDESRQLQTQAVT